MTDARPRKFIGPTQGLRARSGQCLTSNLENIGGRILIQSEMSNHKMRMKKIKSIVNITPPWGHHNDAGLPRPSSAASNASRRPPTASRSSTSLAISQDNGRPGSAALAGSATSVARSQRGGTGTPTPQTRQPAAEFDLAKLTPEQQTTYRDMLRLLSSQSTADSKAMLEQLYREAEDRKLLSAYTGVFPGLENDEHNTSS